MIRKLPRLLLVPLVVAGFSLAPFFTGPAYAAGSGVDVWNPPRGFDSGSDKPHETKIQIGDTVTWYVKEGTHNITPANDVAGGQKWVEKASGDLNVGDPDFVAKNFTKAGSYYYYSSTGDEGKDDHGHLSGMVGVINVVDPNATTTTQPTAPPATTPPTAPPATTPPTTPPATTAPTAPAPAGTHVPTTAAPAPTTTNPPKNEKDKKPKDETTTTTTAPPALGPTNLGADAIVPNVSPDGTVVQNGIEAPGSTPEGDAVALLKEKHGRKGVKLLIVTGLGIGALGIGTAGYKYANRSSKYFPA